MLRKSFQQILVPDGQPVLKLGCTVYIKLGAQQHQQQQQQQEQKQQQEQQQEQQRDFSDAFSKAQLDALVLC
jgi:hypothetical protein